MIVKGDRVYLRAVLESDLDALLERENDIEGRGPFFPVWLTSQPAFRREFERTGFLSEESGRLLICDLEGRPLGDLLYFRATPYFDGYEIDYRLYRLKDSGQGIMTEALALMAYLLFATRKINRLELKIDPGHAASRQVADKNGYRLDYSGSRTPDAQTLRAVHRAHLYAVPFENLDITLGRPISLDRDAVFEKIVTRRRGGFCYELNGLFARLLWALGFRVTLLAARDSHEDGSFGPEFDHRTLRVTCPGDGDQIPWLADVGWGDTFRTTYDGVRQEESVSPDECLDVLRDRFGVTLDASPFDER